MAHCLHQKYSRFRLELIVCKLEELLYRLVIVPLVAFLPAPLAYGIACLRGDWRYRLDSTAREQILRNLHKVLGDQLSPEERHQTTRDFFRRRSCEAIDVMRLAGKGRALARLVEIRGLEHIEAALADGKGVIICSAHFGLYNGGFSLIGACGFPVTTVGDWRSSWANMSPIKRILYRLVHENHLEHHRRPNIEPERERFGKAMLMAEILRSNELITMAIEVPLSAEERARAVPVDFLGRQILLLPGSVSVAQITGSPILVLVVHRRADWEHQVLEISPPVPLDGDPIKAFKHCVKMLEEPIRQNPAYWDWWTKTQNLIDLGLLPTQE
jgi:lauroyl/myristoyl acyltransferase